MRVCLVSNFELISWFNNEANAVTLYSPLGVLSLAAVLEREGHQVSIVDLNYALAENEIALDANFYASAATKILDYQPELVGFSTTCNSYHITLRIAEAIKSRRPELPILFGGPQASVVDVETLDTFPFVDMVLRGEAEVSFPKLLSALSSGERMEVKGLTCRDQGRIVRFPDEQLVANLDSLPIPAYHLFPYKIEGRVPLDVGRGCPFDCSYCSTSAFWKRSFRMKSINRIIHEMQTLRSKYDVNSFFLTHDSLAANRQWLTRFCHQLANEKLEITWSCYARIDSVDPQLLQLMRKAGCREILYGIETGSERMQEAIGKHLQLNKIPTTLDATLNLKIDPVLTFIAGFPDEREEDLAATINLIQTVLGKDIDIRFLLLIPLVGTREYIRNSDKLGFDEYYSVMGSRASIFIEPEWFQQYPKLFASYYFFKNDHLSRDLLKALELFMNGPVTAMRNSILGLLESEGDLLNLFYRWRNWAGAKGLDVMWQDYRISDKLLNSFIEFASEQVAENKDSFDADCARDEVSAFYLSFASVHLVHYENKKDKGAKSHKTI